MKKRILNLLGMMTVGASLSLSSLTMMSAQTISYNAATQPGNQGWTGNLGLDFNVNSSIIVSSLGAFDSSGNGFVGTVRVAIFNRTTMTQVGASLSFNGMSGTLINGDRFQTLSSPIVLSPGSYSIVAVGFSATDMNGNSTSGPPFIPSTENTGGGLISFVGTGRYDANTTLDFPTIVPTGTPSNVFLAGTFQFGPVNSPSFTVVPGIQDQADTDLVNALWVGGLGCPTAVPVAPSGTFTDAGCPTGDNRDIDHEGLLLIKTGPTSNNALSGATLFGVGGIRISELGYDIRAGSVCDAVAPRFDIFTTTGKSYKLACSNPLVPPMSVVSGTGWKRLRWSPQAVNVNTGAVETISDPISSILIIFDEGQDKVPNSGIAVLDNIDINDSLVGKN